ncbi:SusC/RagA family TonB-linked outer membrane protein [Mesonia aquimarina]|uniref:SusC/RagA family TonB-linked outer membrane protein n=1 Tax=Mesonia aquimarina TaxID=1504967 RepID=UPI0013CF1642|nr:SusC/RagA family TonB-linked outer membrane protein [Mesonia aquimarina]
MKNYYTPAYGAGLFMLLLYLYSGQAYGQTTYPLSGTVTDTTGQVIPGVHVQRLGTPQGTTTNFEGQYSLAVQASDSLMFTYLGLTPQRIAVNGRQELHVHLQPDQEALDAVVINAGYYSTTREESTGSIAKVTAKEMEKQLLSSPLEALQGRVPGVVLTQSSGLPGAGVNLQIRGQGSLRSRANYPLYVVDGVPIQSTPIPSVNGLYPANVGFNPLSSLNPDDIESIEVLKDADATAIYGSRGANGVILISTKQGLAGKPQFSIDVRSEVSQVSNQLALLHTEDYLAMRREAFANDEVEPTVANAPDLVLWDQDRYTDWQDKFIGNSAYSHQVSAALKGGSKAMQYRLSGRFRDEETVFPGDFGTQSANVGLHLSQGAPDDAFQAQLSVNYAYQDQSFFNASSLMNTLLTLPPNAPALYDEQGNLNWELDEQGNPTFSNPMALLLQEYSAQTHNLVSNAVLEYEVLPDLRLKANLGYTRIERQEETIYPREAISPAYLETSESNTQTGSLIRTSGIVEPQVLYELEAGASRLQLQAGLTFQQRNERQQQLFGSGYASDALLGSLAPAAEVRLLRDDEEEYRYTAVFGRVGYQYKQRYLLNLTGRRDGSSRFGPGKRFGNFGAIGAGWIASREAWFQQVLPFINFAKLRGSYGITGSDQIGNYGYADTYSPISLFAGSLSNGGLLPSRLANPNYAWEENRKLEAAIDMQLWKNRLQFSVNWFRNRTDNQLIGYNLPATTGFGSVQANLPAEVENKGWELSLSGSPIATDEWHWEIGANISFPSNTLVAYPELESSSYAYQYKIGEPLAIRQLYRYEGIDPETGTYAFTDINGDGVLTPEDYAETAFLGREYYGGLNSSLRYKGFSLDVLVEFVKQQGVGTRGLFAYPPGFRYNQPAGVVEGGENRAEYTQSFGNYMPYSRSSSSELNIEDASYIRVKSLSIAYDLPKSFLRKTGILRTQVYVRGQNLWTFTDYSGLDPQVPGSTNLPILKRLALGLSINF